MGKKALGKGLENLDLDLKDKKKKKTGTAKSIKSLSKEDILQNDKYQVYYQAVEKVFKDEKILPDEEMVLESMRETLEVPVEVHTRILSILKSSAAETSDKKSGRGRKSKKKGKETTTKAEASKPIKGEKSTEGLDKLSEAMGLGVEVVEGEGTDEYKFIAYKKALELTLADGLVTDKEWSILTGLREALGVTSKEHERLEREVREELQVALERKQFEAERAEKRKVTAYRTNEDKIINLEKQLKKTAKSGVNITKPTNYVNTARELLNENKYTEVKVCIAEARKSLTHVKKVNFARKKIDRLDQMFGKAVKMGVDKKAIADRIKEYKDELDAGEFDKLDKDSSEVRTRLQNLLKGKSSLEQIKKTEQLLEKVREMNLDVTNAEDLISKAKSDVEEGKYSKITKKMTKARGELRDLERIKKSGTLIDNIEKDLEAVRATGAEVSLAEKILKKSKDALKSKNFSKVQKSIREIKATLKDSEKMKESLDLLNEVEALITEVRNLGAKVRTADDYLQKAKKALKKKNYRSTNRNANLARRAATDAKENVLVLRATNAISAIQLLISEADKFGADTTQSLEVLKTAQEMFSNKDFSNIDETLNNAEDLAKASLEAAKDRYLYEKVTAEFAAVEELIKETKNKGVDVSSVEQLISNAEGLLDIGKYEELDEIIKNARESTSQALHEFQVSQATESMSAAESLISEAKELGVDVGEAEELLSQAESLFREEDFDALESYVSEAGNIAKERWTEFKAKVASDAITSTQTLIAETREHGLEVDEAEQLLMEAESLFKNEDYDAVEDYVKRAEVIARTSLDDFQATFIMDSFSNVESKIRETQSLGADVTSAQKGLESAKKLFKNKKYDETEDLLKNVEAEITQQFKEYKLKETEAVITYTQQVLDDAKATGANVETAEKIFAEAKDMFNAGEMDISVIFDFVKKAENEVEEARQRHINTATQDAISTTESLIKEIKDIGADVTEAEKLLGQAEDMFKEDDFTAVDQFIKKAETSAEDSKLHFLSEKLSNDILITQRVIMDIKDMGGDVTAPLAELEKASKALKENDFALVDEHIDETKKILDEIKEKQVAQNSRERIDTMEKSLEDIKRLGLGTDDIESVISSARESLEKEDYKGVNTHADNAEELINTAKTNYFATELSKSLETVQTSVEEVGSLGTDIGEARSQLDRAKIFIDEGNFSEAESILNKARSIVDSSKSDFYNKEWQTLSDNIKQRLNETKDLGADISQYEQILTAAEKYAKNGDFHRAKDQLADSEQQINELYETTVNDISENSIKKVEDIISKANGLGADLSEVDKILDKAKEALEQKEFSDVKKLTGEIEEKVKVSKTEYIENKIDEEISPIRKDLEEARDIGAIVSDAEEYIDTAVNSFKEGEMEKALKFTERAKNFVIRAKEKVIKENHPKIDVKVLSSELQDSDWNKLVLSLENTGVIDAKDFRVIFSGDNLEFREPPTIPIIKVGQPMTVEVGVKPTVTGEIPMNLKYFYYRDFDDNEYIREDGKQFKVRPQGSYIIEDVFLTYQNGLLMAHETRKLEDDVQEDVFASMLSAVQDFVKDSFYSKSKLDLNRLDFGDNKILIEKGNYVSLAVVIVADEPTLLPLFMREIIREIEESYMDVLEDWNGVMDELEGINSIIKRLLDVSMDSDEDPGSLPNSHVSTIYNISKNIKSMGGDPAEMEFLLESAIKSGGEGDFSSAWEYLDQAEEKGKIFMSEAFVEGKKIIDNAQETGLDVGDAGQELEDAQKQFREGNYESANVILESTTKTISELKDKSQKVMFNEQITIFEESLSEMESQGVDISGPKAYLLMARSAFDEGDYNKIENFLGRGQDEFIHLKDTYQRDQVTQSIDRAESVLTKVKDVGVQDTSRIEEIMHMLERAKTARDDDDFDSAVEYAMNARKIADSLIEEANERDAAQEALDSASTIITASKSAGVDVTEVEDLISKSKNSFKDGDYLSTQSYTTEVKDMLDKLREPFQTQIASNAINTAQTSIIEAKDFGANVVEAEEVLKDAKSLFEAEEFEKAEARAHDAVNEAKLAKRRKQAELMGKPFEDINALISNVKSIGADVTQAREFYNDAEEALKRLDLEVADEFLKRAESAAEEGRDKYLMDIASEAITLSEKQIDDADGLGVDVTDAKRMLTQAMEMFEDQEYIRAEQYASNASDLLEELKLQFGEKQALDTYNKAKELFREIESLGADMSNAQVNLKLAEEAQLKQDYNMLQTHSQNALDLLRDLKLPYLEKISRDEISSAEEQITAARSFGVDISNAELLLEQARADAEQELWEEVETKAKEAKRIAEEEKTKQYQEQIRNEINTLRTEVMRYESSGIDTTEVTQNLQKAEIALEGKNFANVGKFLKLAKDWTKKAVGLKSRERVTELIHHSDALIAYIKDNIKDIAPEIKNAEKTLQQAKKAFKDKKYTFAEKSGNASKELVEKINHPNLDQFLFVFKSLQTEEMLNSIRNMISELNKKQIDTQEIKTFLKKAEFAFESDETYEKGKDYIIEAKLRAKEATRKYQSKIASKYISTAQSQIISVKRMGVNVREAEVYLEKSKIAFKAQEFQKSKMIADKVILALKKAKKS